MNYSNFLPGFATLTQQENAMDALKALANQRAYPQPNELYPQSNELEFNELNDYEIEVELNDEDLEEDEDELDDEYTEEDAIEYARMMAITEANSASNFDHSQIILNQTSAIASTSQLQPEFSVSPSPSFAAQNDLEKTRESSSSASPKELKVQAGTSTETLYVNAKQYTRIIKRRAARARLEEMGRLSRERKVS